MSKELHVRLPQLWRNSSLPSSNLVQRQRKVRPLLSDKDRVKSRFPSTNVSPLASSIESWSSAIRKGKTSSSQFEGECSTMAGFPRVSSIPISGLRLTTRGSTVFLRSMRLFREMLKSIYGKAFASRSNEEGLGILRHQVSTFEANSTSRLSIPLGTHPRSLPKWLTLIQTYLFSQ